MQGRGRQPPAGSLGESEHPRLAALGDRWAVLAARDIHPEGIRAFVDGLDITLQNFTLANNRIVERPCTDNLTIRNVTLTNSTIVRC